MSALIVGDLLHPVHKRSIPKAIDKRKKRILTFFIALPASSALF